MTEARPTPSSNVGRELAPADRNTPDSWILESLAAPRAQKRPVLRNVVVCGRESPGIMTALRAFAGSRVGEPT